MLQELLEKHKKKLQGFVSQASTNLYKSYSVFSRFESHDISVLNVTKMKPFNTPSFDLTWEIKRTLRELL